MLTLPVEVTPRALSRIDEIAAAEGAPRMLRVAVLGGGCSGFQYEFRLEERPAEGDAVLGGRVLIDSDSMPFLGGAVVDYEEKLIGAKFVIQNPNATSSCGCGTSFAL